MADQGNDQSDQGNDQDDRDATGPVSDLLAAMIADSLEASSLDPREFMLVRLAALIAMDAPPLSYLGTLAVAGDVGITREDVEGVATAIAPVVGTVRVVSAAGKIARALGIAIVVATEMEMELEAEEAIEAEEAMEAEAESR
jgi:hypothetical protein